MTDILLRPFIALQIAVHELREREDGQTTTEYAILLGFLAIAIIIALFFLRNVLRQLFSDAAAASRTRRTRPIVARRRPRTGRLDVAGRHPSTRPAHPVRPWFTSEREAEGLVGTHPSAGCRIRPT